MIEVASGALVAISTSGGMAEHVDAARAALSEFAEAGSKREVIGIAMEALLAVSTSPVDEEDENEDGDALADDLDLEEDAV